MTQVVPNLWIGGEEESINRSFLKRHIDIIINCSTDLPFIPELDEFNIEYIRLPVNDLLNPEDNLAMLHALPKITYYIWKNLKQGRRILVHCYAGKQRSAAVIAAYLITYMNLTAQQAILLLQSKRIICFTPSCNFESALLQTEIMAKAMK